MGRWTIKFGAWLLVFAWSVAISGASSPALGGLIAGDSYTIGTSDPFQGQYAGGVALRSQSPNLTTPGFATGSPAYHAVH